MSEVITGIKPLLDGARISGNTHDTVDGVERYSITKCLNDNFEIVKNAVGTAESGTIMEECSEIIDGIVNNERGASVLGPWVECEITHIMGDDWPHYIGKVNHGARASDADRDIVDDVFSDNTPLCDVVHQLAQHASRVVSDVNSKISSGEYYNNGVLLRGTPAQLSMGDYNFVAPAQKTRFDSKLSLNPGNTAVISGAVDVSQELREILDFPTNTSGYANGTTTSDIYARPQVAILENLPFEIEPRSSDDTYFVSYNYVGVTESLGARLGCSNFEVEEYLPEVVFDNGIADGLRENNNASNYVSKTAETRSDGKLYFGITQKGYEVLTSNVLPKFISALRLSRSFVALG